MEAALPVLCLALCINPEPALLPGRGELHLGVRGELQAQAGCGSLERDGVTAPALCSLTLLSKLH